MIFQPQRAGNVAASRMCTQGVDVVDQDDVPIFYPAKLAGDKGYRADWIDDYLIELGIQPVIPSKENEDRDARPVEFDREA